MNGIDPIICANCGNYAEEIEDDKYFCPHCEYIGDIITEQEE